MSKRKLRIHQTQGDVLVSNLRGEIGEVIVSWTLLRRFRAEIARTQTADVAADMQNPQLTFLSIIADKLANEIVARLAELAEMSDSRLTFHLAASKLGRFAQEAERFTRFVRKHRLKEKRDRDISHKVAPQTWDARPYLHIDYKLIVRGVALALRLMKKIDRHFLGPSSPLLWQKVRKKRYEPMGIPGGGYILLPHMFLTTKERQQVIIEEMSEGLARWELAKTSVNGAEVTIPVYRKWSGVLLGSRLLVLETYPLIELTKIEIDQPSTASPSVLREGGEA